MQTDDIAAVRQFNRAFSQRIGALEESYLSRGRPLGEARVIFDIGPDGIDVAALRDRLGLDSGYLSRLLRSLEMKGLVRVRKDDSDGRRRRAVLTASGKTEFEAYEQLSDDLASSIVGALGAAQRSRLLAAMAELERLIEAGAIELRTELPESADARWCLGQYFAELGERFEEGFDPAIGNSVQEEAMRPPRGVFLVARLHGKPVGCGVLTRIDDEFGEIKRMWIDPKVRGIGLASRILTRLEDIAGEFGWAKVRLDTNRTLAEAQAMYRKAGYREIGRYNDNPYADYWFEKEL